MKRILALLVFLLILSIPVMAQDATAEPTAAPIVVMIPAEQLPDETPAILSLTIGELMAIVVGLVGLAFAGGKILWDANQNPGGPSVDERLTERVGVAQADRQWMDSVERGVALSNAGMKTALDAVVSVLQTIAPLTPLKVDDAALNLLKDIQTPGFTAQAAAADTGTGYTITGNQDGVTITADTSPVSGYASTSTMVPPTSAG